MYIQSLMAAANAVDDNENKKNVIIGLLLGISSSVFIGSSFIFKKKALMRLSLRAGTSAVQKQEFC